MKHAHEHQNNTSPAQRGFTLVQLLIAAAILAVLAAMAYPAWQKHVRSREAEAQSLLDDAAKRIDSHRTQHGDHDANALNAVNTAGQPTLPHSGQ